MLLVKVVKRWIQAKVYAYINNDCLPKLMIFNENTLLKI